MLVARPTRIIRSISNTKMNSSVYDECYQKLLVTGATRENEKVEKHRTNCWRSSIPMYLWVSSSVLPAIPVYKLCPMVDVGFAIDHHLQNSSVATSKCKRVSVSHLRLERGRSCRRKLLAYLCWESFWSVDSIVKHSSWPWKRRTTCPPSRYPIRELYSTINWCQV